MLKQIAIATPILVVSTHMLLKLWMTFENPLIIDDEVARLCKEGRQIWRYLMGKEIRKAILLVKKLTCLKDITIIADDNAVLKGRQKDVIGRQT